MGRPAAELDASRIEISLAGTWKSVPSQGDPLTLTGSCTTDHMLVVTWTDEEGWGPPSIKPYGPIELYPTASCLHYATECFEGMRVYRGFDGKVRLFRPERNAARFRRSSSRISLPDFSIEAFLRILNVFVSIEAPLWLPEPGRCAYLRPTMIGTGNAIGMSKPTEAMMLIVMVIIPSMNDGMPTYKTSAYPQTNSHQAGMRLLTSQTGTARAWPGGFGSHKLGANYGPTILAQTEAATKGYHQILWLFGEHDQITEAGASNFFALVKARGTGRLILMTPPLKEGIILDGVIRASVLELAAKLEEINVVERDYTIWDLIEADQDGRLVEAFVTGTAYFISPVQGIHFRGRDILPPLAKDRKDDGQTSSYASLIREQLKAIMYGNVASEWAVEVSE